MNRTKEFLEEYGKVCAKYGLYIEAEGYVGEGWLRVEKLVYTGRLERHLKELMNKEEKGEE